MGDFLDRHREDDERSKDPATKRATTTQTPDHLLADLQPSLAVMLVTTQSEMIEGNKLLNVVKPWLASAETGSLFFGSCQMTPLYKSLAVVVIKDLLHGHNHRHTHTHWRPAHFQPLMLTGWSHFNVQNPLWAIASFTLKCTGWKQVFWTALTPGWHVYQNSKDFSMLFRVCVQLCPLANISVKTSWLVSISL